MVGVRTLLSWDLDSVTAAAIKLAADSERIRGCFRDFRTRSDLQASWSGVAADAASEHAQALARQLYVSADLIGWAGSIIGRRVADLVIARETVCALRRQAEAAQFTVSDDGSVTLARSQIAVAAKSDWAASNPAQHARELTERLTAALRAVDIADQDLARALSSAWQVVSERASNVALIDRVVHFVEPRFVGPVTPGIHPRGGRDDPFLADAVGPLVGAGSLGFREGGRLLPPSDPEFATWFAALTPHEKQQSLDALRATATPLGHGHGFFAGIQAGELPGWAKDLNRRSLGCVDADSGAPHKGMTGYGYFGGGTIAGPAGGQWPIVNPYYSDGSHVFLDDANGITPSGGINELDGRDPGWHRVSIATGLAAFGSISPATKIATGLASSSGTGGPNGRDLTVSITAPQDVRVGSNGVPQQGDARKSVAGTPTDKPYWDVRSTTSHPSDELPPSHPIDGMDNAVGLVTQVLETANAVHDVSAHAQRQWWVDYQINDDGRTRAVVRTFTAAIKSNQREVIGGFANAFPSGQRGATAEIPINTRYLPGEATITPAGGPEVNGDSHRGGMIFDGPLPIRERLEK
ncbi:hypothetical protein ACSMXN_19250 [Jatrophihabitans sp. DSM 45814]